MKKVTHLTEEQKSKLADYVEKWTAIGLSTETANRIEAEKYINLAYSNAGLKLPEKIVWCGSPLSLALTRAIILNEKILYGLRSPSRDPVTDSFGNYVIDSVVHSVMNSVMDFVGHSLTNSVVYSMWSSLSANFSDSVVCSFKDSVLASVKTSVKTSVSNSVRASVWEAIWEAMSEFMSESMWDSAWDYLDDSILDSAYLQHDTSWLGAYDFLRNECRLTKETEKTTGLMGIAKNAGLLLPLEKICFVSERPNILNLNEYCQLHCVDGPAIAYPDGFEVYAVNGVLAPEWIIKNKEEITISKIKKEKNEKIKLIMIELYEEFD